MVMKSRFLNLALFFWGVGLLTGCKSQIKMEEHMTNQYLIKNQNAAISRAISLTHLDLVSDKVDVNEAVLDKGDAPFFITRTGW